MSAMQMRFLPVSHNALLVELPDLARTLDLLAALQAEQRAGQSAGPLAGVSELVPAARTILVYFDPWQTSAASAYTSVMMACVHTTSIRPKASPASAPVRNAGVEARPSPAMTRLAVYPTSTTAPAAQSAEKTLSFHANDATGTSRAACASSR